MKFILLIILAILGFTLSFYLLKKKSKKEKLVCVIGKDCNKVLESKYGELFGIDNIILGILYYIFIFLISFSTLIYPAFLILNLFSIIILLSSGMALLFSIYLSFIQIKILKELCEYCLASALINLLIFLTVVL